MGSIQNYQDCIALEMLQSYIKPSISVKFKASPMVHDWQVSRGGGY